MTKREHSREERKKKFVRIVCLAVAVVMCVGIIASAVFAQIW